MTSYRNDLSSAHARIAQLEGELASVRGQRPVPSPPNAPAREPPTTLASVPLRSTWWSAERAESLLRVAILVWPIPVLLAAVVTYAVRFGATAPQWTVGELVPLERGSLLCAAASAFLMCLASLLRMRANGESTVAQRLLAVVAALVSAPLLVFAAFGLMEAGSIVLAVLGTAGAVIAGLVWLVNWIRGA
jgi:hypothetical protein